MTLFVGTTYSRTRSTKLSQDHPAFDDSDSESEDQKSKAELFQELLLQNERTLDGAPPNMEQSSPPKVKKQKHACFLRNLHLKHRIHFHSERKEQFQIINGVSDVTVPPEKTLQPDNGPTNDIIEPPRRLYDSLERIPSRSPRSPTKPLLTTSRPESSITKRKRRHTIGDIHLSSRAKTRNDQLLLSLMDQVSGPPQPAVNAKSTFNEFAPVDSPLDPFIIRYRPPTLSVQTPTLPIIDSFNPKVVDEVNTSIKSSTDDTDTPPRSSSSLNSSRLSKSSSSTERIMTPEQATRFSSVPWEVEVNAIKAKTDLLSVLSIDTVTPFSVFSILRDPATVAAGSASPLPGTNRTEFTTEPVLEPKIWPSNLRKADTTGYRPTSELTPEELNSPEQRRLATPPPSSPMTHVAFSKLSESQGSTPTTPLQSLQPTTMPPIVDGPATAITSPSKAAKPQRLKTLVRFVSMLHSSWTPAGEPASNEHSSDVQLPKLEYSPLAPIWEHEIAISSRVKEEFKLKLSKQIDLPTEDGATVDELIADVRDLNEEISKCAKGLAKLMVRANLRTSKEAKPSNLASESVEAIEASVRTQLNLFLVSRVIRPFSVDLSSSDNEALRTRYDDIASKVPQFIASRWRVLASSSTSRPIQLMTPVLSQLTSDATSAILGDLNLNLQLASMMMEPLAPVVRQAYLLGHFIHLEMITADFDVFYGSEIGEPIVISQEENHRKTKHFKRSSLSKQEGRVCGYWSLGLRGKQFVSDGLTQRQTWDVILKPKVLLASSEL